MRSAGAETPNALRAHRPMRTMAAVNPLCTSFATDLRRIVRSRNARALVWVLALALSVANTMTAAMPPPAAAAGSPDATLPHQASHPHCAGHAAHATHAGHDDGCACCVGKTCACVHVCDALTLMVLPTMTAPSARMFSVPPPRAYAAIEARPLRPPIA